VKRLGESTLAFDLLFRKGSGISGLHECYAGIRKSSYRRRGLITGIPPTVSIRAGTARRRAKHVATVTEFIYSSAAVRAWGPEYCPDANPRRGQTGMSWGAAAP